MDGCAVVEEEKNSLASDRIPGEEVSKVHRWQLGQSSVEAVLEAFRNGRMVIIIDCAEREHEGDLMLPAQFATPDNIAYMVKHTSGVLCVAMEEERLQQLKIPPMVQQNEDFRRTAFCVSVDAKDGSTGISASSRSRTVRLLADPSARAHDFQRPGHVFPLRALPNGVLQRQGHTEASLDLCKMAGLRAVAVIGEVVSTQCPTEMARTQELLEFGIAEGIALTTVQDIVCYRLSKEKQNGNIAPPNSTVVLSADATDRT